MLTAHGEKFGGRKKKETTTAAAVMSLPKKREDFAREQHCGGRRKEESIRKVKACPRSPLEEKGKRTSLTQRALVSSNSNEGMKEEDFKLAASRKREIAEKEKGSDLLLADKGTVCSREKSAPVTKECVGKRMRAYGVVHEKDRGRAQGFAARLYAERKDFAAWNLKRRSRGPRLKKDSPSHLAPA